MSHLSKKFLFEQSQDYTVTKYKEYSKKLRLCDIKNLSQCNVLNFFKNFQMEQAIERRFSSMRRKQ